MDFLIISLYQNVKGLGHNLYVIIDS